MTHGEMGYILFQLSHQGDIMETVALALWGSIEVRQELFLNPVQEPRLLIHNTP